jgi:lipopolysaccharide/colanic/teichoic acid biosynthesis glycosyltransferase
MSSLTTSLPIQKSVLNHSSTIQNEQITVHPSVTSKTKRLIDVLGALVGLSITAAVAIPVAIATQLDNPGPIFYSQTRCGLNGRTFRIWKFRSMVMGAEKLKHLLV